VLESRRVWGNRRAEKERVQKEMEKILVTRKYLTKGGGESCHLPEGGGPKILYPLEYVSCSTSVGSTYAGKRREKVKGESNNNLRLLLLWGTRNFISEGKCKKGHGALETEKKKRRKSRGKGKKRAMCQVAGLDIRNVIVRK